MPAPIAAITMGAFVLLIVLSAVLWAPGTTTSARAEANMHRSSTCDCCMGWARYYKGLGHSLSIDVHEDVTPIKDDAGIPSHVRSCHTTFLEGYVVEGHIPDEAIERLLGERPTIRGIALPGMPHGSPGMGGEKMEDWIIQAIDLDGTTRAWMTI